MDMYRAETEERERQKRDKKYRREREARERRQREEREPDRYHISETDKQAKNGKNISKKASYSRKKGKLKLSQQDTLRLMRVKLLQIRKGSWKGKLLYCESMVEG